MSTCQVLKVFFLIRGDPNDNTQLSEINKKVALNYVQDSDFKK